MKPHSITKPNVLIVDDSRDIRESLCQYFTEKGLRISTAANAEEARWRLNESVVDLVILDIMMPGEDGLSLCRWMASHTETPVILLTAVSSDMDRIIGLEIGADDYVVKPFNPRELLARIRAVLRRHSGKTVISTVQIRQFAQWTHNPTLSVIRQGDSAPIKLTSAENRLLCVFLDNPNKVLARSVLVDRVLRREEKAFDRAIDNKIVRLRKKIENDPANPEILITEWGLGYKLIAQVVDVNSQ